MSTHNLCLSQFYCIKVGCKGVFVTQTCFRDVWQLTQARTLDI